MHQIKEFTMQEVSIHNTKADLYFILHDKVYDCSDFLEKHPGGEEVLLDIAGQDGTEAFEDVGHSNEAREILGGLCIGHVERVSPNPNPGDKVNITKSNASFLSSSTTLYVTLCAFILIGGLMAYGVREYLDAQRQQQ